MLEGLLRGFSQPEYVHTLLNPLPIYGLGIALLGLLLGLIFRSRPAQVIALTLTFISATSAWPVVHYGHKAYDQVLTLADDDGRAWLEEHEERGDKLIYFFYALAVVSAAAILIPRKWPRTAQPLAIATVVLAILSLGAGASIAYAGGKIRHREFRNVPPPVKEPSR
jgi:disulfide bond formation protein DsbB